jgi:hypothetical protein
MPAAFAVLPAHVLVCRTSRGRYKPPAALPSTALFPESPMRNLILLNFSAILAIAATLSPLSAKQTHSDAPAGEPWVRHVIDNTSHGADGTKLGDINRNGLLDVTTGWEEGGVTRVYLNPGPARARQPWPKVTIGKTPSAEDAVFADLDGDGFLDVVSSAEGSTQQVYVHWAPASVSELLNPDAWKQEVFPALDRVTRWMFAEPLQIDGRHGVDLVIGGKYGREPAHARSVLGWLESPASPRDVAAWKWHPLVEVGWTMSIVLEDMDGDGDLDILCSDRFGPTRGVFWLENPGPAKALVATNWKRHDIGAATADEIMFLTTGDIDGDGLRDIAVAIEVEKRNRADPNRHSRILWFKRLDGSGKRWAEHVIGVPANTGNAKAVAIGDVDGDGRADLVVSCENASAGRTGVYWLRHDGDPAAATWAAHNIAGPAGIKFDLVRLLDLDGDGDLDVLTNEESEGGVGLGVIWYENPLGRRTRR